MFTGGAVTGESTRESARGTAQELGHLLRAGPFHLALRAALTARGLPLHRVQQRLAAVSYT
ncbi:hypothetical protein VR46_45060, partial [Streptomyces sp. NRRL S-444]